jgi:hypothetical protein
MYSGAKWPKHLILQLIPLQTLRSFISKLTTVKFDLAEDDQTSLYAAMKTTFSGCVIFGNKAQPHSSDIQVLIILFTGKKRDFICCIPLDQEGLHRCTAWGIQRGRRKQQASDLQEASLETAVWLFQGRAPTGHRTVAHGGP